MLKKNQLYSSSMNNNAYYKTGLLHFAEVEMSKKVFTFESVWTLSLSFRSLLSSVFRPKRMRKERKAEIWGLPLKMSRKEPPFPPPKERKAKFAEKETANLQLSAINSEGVESNKTLNAKMRFSKDSLIEKRRKSNRTRCALCYHM